MEGFSFNGRRITFEVREEAGEFRVLVDPDAASRPALIMGSQLHLQPRNATLSG